MSVEFLQFVGITVKERQQTYINFLELQHIFSCGDDTELDTFTSEVDHAICKGWMEKKLFHNHIVLTITKCGWELITLSQQQRDHELSITSKLSQSQYFSIVITNLYGGIHHHRLLKGTLKTACEYINAQLVDFAFAETVENFNTYVKDWVTTEKLSRNIIIEADGWGVQYSMCWEVDSKALVRPYLVTVKTIL